MLVPRKVVRRLKKSPPKFFFVACPVTCENYNWSSSTKRVCVCVKKSWSLTICCWIFTKRSLFVPFLQQSSNSKKQLKTQGSLGIEHIPVTAKSKIPRFLDLSPPKKQKIQPWSTLFLVANVCPQTVFDHVGPGFRVKHRLWCMWIDSSQSQVDWNWIMLVCEKTCSKSVPSVANLQALSHTEFVQVYPDSVSSCHKLCAALLTVRMVNT